ncbi:hypothetical protein ABK040_011650 [Willaertia magna]
MEQLMNATCKKFEITEEQAIGFFKNIVKHTHKINFKLKTIPHLQYYVGPEESSEDEKIKEYDTTKVEPQPVNVPHNVVYLVSSDDEFNFAIEEKHNEEKDEKNNSCEVKKENIAKEHATQEKRKRTIKKESPQKKKVEQILAPLGLNTKLHDAKETIKKALNMEQRLQFEGLYEKIMKVDYGLKKILHFTSMPTLNNVEELIEFKHFLRVAKNMNYIFVHALYNLFVLDLQQKKFSQKYAKEYYLNNDYYEILGYGYGHFSGLERVGNLIDVVPGLLFHYIDEETFSINHVQLQEFIGIMCGVKFEEKLRFLPFVKSMQQKQQIENSSLNNINFYAIMNDSDYGVAFGKLISISKEAVYPSVDLDIFITRCDEYHIGVVKDIPLFKIKIIRQSHGEYLNLERVYNKLKNKQ